jgi:hypothetical protein
LENKRKQHLDGMQLFDTASRGPLGSLFILLEHKGQTFVSLGALVIVLGLIFDPSCSSCSGIPCGKSSL